MSRSSTAEDLRRSKRTQAGDSRRAARQPAAGRIACPTSRMFKLETLAGDSRRPAERPAESRLQAGLPAPLPECPNSRRWPETVGDLRYLGCVIHCEVRSLSC